MLTDLIILRIPVLSVPPLITAELILIVLTAAALGVLLWNTPELHRPRSPECRPKEVSKNEPNHLSEPRSAEEACPEPGSRGNGSEPGKKEETFPLRPKVSGFRREPDAAPRNAEHIERKTEDPERP